MDFTKIIKNSKIKTRVFPEHNYKAIHVNGKTIRLALDSTKPISELLYPEFYDVKITSFCKGNCKICYQSSLSNCKHPSTIIKKFNSFFGSMNENQKPFQIAFGGGEPTSHPKFCSLMKASYDMGIVPNYTTNGMWVGYSNSKQQTILNSTKKYCGGVAVSTHPQLKSYWERAIDLYLEQNVFTNLHVIIGDKKSIDEFANVYKRYHEKVKYFVLLPLVAQGRSTKSFSDWQYFKSKVDGSPADIAFGANFYPYLLKDKTHQFNVSLYTPEIFSAYLSLEDMKVTKSSFSNETKTIGGII
jgi:organic radical activating enzyme